MNFEEKVTIGCIVMRYLDATDMADRSIDGMLNALREYLGRVATLKEIDIAYQIYMSEVRF